MKSRYQIQFARNGSASYEYFEATAGEATAAACLKANESLGKQRERAASSIFLQPFRPIRTVRVVEYDGRTKRTKRNGHRFKLVLRYAEFWFKGGERQRSEWYSAEEGQ